MGAEWGPLKCGFLGAKDQPWAEEHNTRPSRPAENSWRRPKEREGGDRKKSSSGTSLWDLSWGLSLLSQLTLVDYLEKVSITKSRAAAETSQPCGNSWKSCWRNADMVRDRSKESEVGNSLFKVVLEHFDW